MNRPMGVFKTNNEYQQRIDPSLYADTPKAVLAALLVSFMDRCNDAGYDVDAAIREEWQLLHVQEIVPQKPK